MFFVVHTLSPKFLFYPQKSLRYALLPHMFIHTPGHKRESVGWV
jgi:hypothetical protein